MQTSLKKIAYKAKCQKRYRFQNLFRLLNEESLAACWSRLNKRAAVGIDGITYQLYQDNLTENIHRLVESLKQKRYRAKLIRRRYIPKEGGKQRPLGIPVTEDKLLQYAVMLILLAIFEQDLLPNCFGYRPSKNAHDAVDELNEQLFYGSYHWVVEADVQGFFDNIDHQWMVRMLEQRIDDKAFLWLIRKWLKAGVLEEDGKVIHPLTGTPQGGIISPILANIYMHYCLNLWFEKVFKKNCRGQAYLCVYADDFVACFQHREGAQAFYDALGGRLAKFNLTLSPDKTNIIRFSRYDIEENSVFEFLGFEFRWTTSRRGKVWLKRSTSKKRLKSSIRNFKQWCRENRHVRLRSLFRTLNSKLRGHYNYYGVMGNLDGIHRFYYRAEQILFKWLNRRSQRNSYTWAGFYIMRNHFKIEKPRHPQRYAQIVAHCKARS